MATETMLYLALKQEKWAQAAKIAIELSEKNGNVFYRSLAKTARKAFNQDSRSILLLKIWVNTRWKSLKK